jgi:hypothetical protein
MAEGAPFCLRKNLGMPIDLMRPKGEKNNESIQEFAELCRFSKYRARRRQ